MKSKNKIKSALDNLFKVDKENAVEYLSVIGIKL